MAINETGFIDAEEDRNFNMEFVTAMALAARIALVPIGDVIDTAENLRRKGETHYKKIPLDDGTMSVLRAIQSAQTKISKAELGDIRVGVFDFGGGA